MKFWEAMKALDEGKKVRIKGWDASDYLDNSVEGGNIQHISIAWPHSFFCQWEFYQEPQEPMKTYAFLEAIQLMRAGRTIKRINSDPLCAGWSMRKIDTRGFMLRDIEATDWIIMEDV